MPVLQFVEHLRQNAEEFFVAHLVVEAGAVGGVYLVPVDVLIGEEAVTLVENGPKRVEVAVRRLAELFLWRAGREACEGEPYCQHDFVPCVKSLFHRLNSMLVLWNVPMSKVCG